MKTLITTQVATTTRPAPPQGVGKGGARQRGAALVVGLVLLMVLTVLGVSGMTTSLLEVAMTANAKQKLYAFQAVESAVDEAIVSEETITVDDTTVAGAAVRNVIQFDIQDSDGATVTRANANTTYNGFSDGALGWGSSTVGSMYFRVDATTDQSIDGARSNQRAGFYIVAPGP